MTALEPGDKAILDHLEAVSGCLNSERLKVAPRSIGGRKEPHMTMLDEAKTNGHAEPVTRAWDARLAAFDPLRDDERDSGRSHVCGNENGSTAHADRLPTPLVAKLETARPRAPP